MIPLRRGYPHDESARRARMINLAGKQVGRCVVVRLSENKRLGARWILRCQCGNEFEVLGFNVRDAGPNYACPTCRPRGRRPVRSPIHCTECGSGGHNRATCPRRTMPSKSPLACFGCAGLPHRRPKDGCVCGGRYAPEAPVTIDDVMAMPAKAPRECA